MRESIGIVALLSIIYTFVLIQNVSGAAVMSIDFGSEWMKVYKKKDSI